MRVRFSKIASFVLVGVILAACTSEPPPIDSTGVLPDKVLLDTYQHILKSEFAEAEKIFDPRWKKAIFPPSNPKTFAQWATEHTKTWQLEALTTEIMGNDYNDNVWRVRVKSDLGKGKDNPAGAVHDLAQIDGKWRIVFWGDYPES